MWRPDPWFATNKPPSNGCSFLSDIMNNGLYSSSQFEAKYKPLSLIQLLKSTEEILLG